jgi:hypothetical protein
MGIDRLQPKSSLVICGIITLSKIVMNAFLFPYHTLTNFFADPMMLRISSFSELEMLSMELQIF